MGSREGRGKNSLPPPPSFYAYFQFYVQNVELMLILPNVQTQNTNKQLLRMTTDSHWGKADQDCDWGGNQ